MTQVAIENITPLSKKRRISHQPASKVPTKNSRIESRKPRIALPKSVPVPRTVFIKGQEYTFNPKTKKFEPTLKIILPKLMCKNHNTIAKSDVKASDDKICDVENGVTFSKIGPNCEIKDNSQTSDLKSEKPEPYLKIRLSTLLCKNPNIAKTDVKVPVHKTYNVKNDIALSKIGPKGGAKDNYQPLKIKILPLKDDLKALHKVTKSISVKNPIETSPKKISSKLPKNYEKPSEKFCQPSMRLSIKIMPGYDKSKLYPQRV